MSGTGKCHRCKVVQVSSCWHVGPTQRGHEDIEARHLDSQSFLRLTVVTWLICLGLLSHQSFQSFAAEPPRIVDGSSVIVMYRISILGDGRSEAVYFGQFVQGHHKLLPVLEREVRGMKPGDEKKIELAPEEGFGPYDEQKKKTVPRTELPAGAHEGDVVEDPTGKEMTVTQLSGRSAVVDYNHPLAGKPLSVKILILDVKDPS